MVCFAPMEGITGYIFRNTYNSFFEGIDTFYTPFIPTSQKDKLPAKYKRDIAPENNAGISLIPQLLSKDPVRTAHTAVKICSGYGYGEIDLNCGCPSGTVTANGRGAAMLSDPDSLDAFFETLFMELDRISAEGVKVPDISVKTRIGMSFVSEAEDIIKIYNRYPISTLIIHPRLKDEYYGGNVHMDIFSQMYEESIHPVIYNGDINRAEDYNRIVRDYPDLKAVMIGRGLLKDPALAERIKGIRRKEDYSHRLKEYIRALCDGYYQVYRDERNTLFKMKEMWSFLADNTKDPEKTLRSIRRADSLGEYKATVNRIFEFEIFSVNMGIL
ncbi:MAG: tRNA-dihydrouridine synthase family protein [Lachnospiraceae bacterium]|nr:tRNA-dihydrouridine synthase family protein [Lachnospiraceae bacterium]